MFCSNCGNSIETAQVFCVSCGQRLNAQSLATPVSIHQLSQPRVDLNTENAPKPMNFIETINFSYKNYARFSGRAARSEYWFWVLFVLIGFIGLLMLMVSFSPELPIIFLLIFQLSVIIPGIARGVRRLHDINKSGAFLFIGLVPFVGVILLLVWFCTKSDSIPNIYGPALSERVASTKSMSFESEVPSNKNPSKVDDTIGPKAITKSFIVKNKVLVFTTILVVVLLGVLQSHVQYGKLIGSIEISEEQMNEYNNELSEQYREHGNAAGGFLSDESRIAYENEAKSYAGIYKSRIQNAGKTIDNVLLMPWNINHREVKKYYLAHNLAWQKNLAREKIDPYSNEYSEEVSSTWINFCSELKSYVPWYLLGRFDSRITKICISDADPTTN